MRLKIECLPIFRCNYTFRDSATRFTSFIQVDSEATMTGGDIEFAGQPDSLLAKPAINASVPSIFAAV